eukprot:917576-Rhodomonas_salina.2
MVELCKEMIAVGSSCPMVLRIRYATPGANESGPMCYYQAAKNCYKCKVSPRRLFLPLALTACPILATVQ